MDRIERLEAPDWFLQPGDKIAETVVAQMKTWRVFRAIFGDSIVDYKRADFPARELPALRVYNDTGRADSDTWYLTGELKLDVIFPASLRRSETQRLPQLVASAIMALFRSQKFFDAVKAAVPRLNELGKSYSWDKALGFVAPDAEEINPLTQVTANFRVLLEEWDRYMEDDDRTRDDPFDKTLGDLETLYLKINAVNDAGTVAVADVANSTINVKKEQ